MQSLERAMTQVQQQLSARSAQSHNATTSTASKPNDSASSAADPSAVGPKRSGALVDCYV
jgi:hypothetical protein